MRKSREFRYFCNFVAISRADISVVTDWKSMKILHDRVLAVDYELKKFYVDWMKAQIITELWKLKIKRAQKLAVFLHFESSSV